PGIGEQHPVRRQPGGRQTGRLGEGQLLRLALLAAVRAEPVLALDGAATEGALGFFLPPDRNGAVPRDLAALPLGPAYEDVRALTTRLPSGLEVVAHRAGHYGPNSAHAQEYLRVLAHTAPYYPFLLTDWAPVRVDRTADVVLDHTDQLIVCCGAADWFLDAAARTLDRIRESGRHRLADQAVVVTTRTDGSHRRGLPDNLHWTLGVQPDQVVQVPFDTALQSPRWRLEDLRPATVHAYLRLAELVVRPL
ncbi:MinD/ParA family ATP-binding protein, partial [Streptomyces olivaceoviridis]